MLDVEQIVRRVAEAVEDVGEGRRPDEVVDRVELGRGDLRERARISGRAQQRLVVVQHELATRRRAHVKLESRTLVALTAGIRSGA